MEKSNLEKALENTLNLKQMEDLEMDIPDKYKSLRQTEMAYEDLTKSGIDVSEQLKERRYQIAELVTSIMSAEAENIHRMVSGRNENWIGDLTSEALVFKECAEKLDKYLKSLYPNDFKDEGYKPLFPEP